MTDAAMALDRGDAPAIGLDEYLPTTQAQKVVDLFPRKEVMKAFDMRSNDKFYRMLDTGDLEAVYHGSRVLVTGASLRRCLAALPKYQPRQAAE